MENTTNKSPAFQWYPKDILSSARVQEMTLAEEGAYRRLIDYCWLHGSIPSDPRRAARIIGKGATPEIAKVCLEMFTAHPEDETRLIHDRLEVEREKQEHNRKARQEAANARWSKRGTPAAGSGKQANTGSDANALQKPSERKAPANAKSQPIEAKDAREGGQNAVPPNAKPVKTETGEDLNAASEPDANAMQMHSFASSSATSFAVAKEELSGGGRQASIRAREPTDRPTGNLPENSNSSSKQRQWLELSEEEKRMTMPEFEKHLQALYPEKNVREVVADCLQYCRDRPGIVFCKERIKGWVAGQITEITDEAYLTAIGGEIEKGAIVSNGTIRRASDGVVDYSDRRAAKAVTRRNIVQSARVRAEQRRAAALSGCDPADRE